MRSEVCCANYASPTMLTKHSYLFGLLCQHLHSAQHLRVQCPFTLCPLPLSLWPCFTRNKRQPHLIITTGQQSVAGGGQSVGTLNSLGSNGIGYHSPEKYGPIPNTTQYYQILGHTNASIILTLDFTECFGNSV